MAKKEINLSEFREIIREEAIKLKDKMIIEAEDRKKKTILENEKKALEAELKSINENYTEEGEDAPSKDSEE